MKTKYRILEYKLFNAPARFYPQRKSFLIFWSNVRMPYEEIITIDHNIYSAKEDEFSDLPRDIFFATLKEADLFIREWLLIETPKSKNKRIIIHKVNF